MGEKHLQYKSIDLDIFTGTHKRPDVAHICNRSTPRAWMEVEKELLGSLGHSLGWSSPSIWWQRIVQIQQIIELIKLWVCSSEPMQCKNRWVLCVYLPSFEDAETSRFPRDSWPVQSSQPTGHILVTERPYHIYSMHMKVKTQPIKFP